MQRIMYVKNGILIEQTPLLQSLFHQNGMNCLHYASKGGHIDVVKYLLTNTTIDASDRDEVNEFISIISKFIT